jgi:predicted lysophospholipase L1 biosynthesis ABC-type transport system permease subunit
VTVINEAFAKRFFAGRNPLGMRITTVYGDRRRTHHVVGVSADARTHRLRGEVPPRYFVPVTQPLGDFDSVVFEIRTAGEPGAALAAVRKTILARDANLAIVDAGTVDARLESATAQDRLMARLSMAFGLVALTLAAIGLYGVLSYGVSRRQGEIGIRITLGAQPARVVRMILGETALLLGAGLAAGVCLALAAARLIASQLFGLAPSDPATLAAAVALLAAVALAAAYLPAHRASRVDPLMTLRQE